MTQESPNTSAVEITIDEQTIRLEGSEEFVGNWALKAVNTLSGENGAGAEMAQLASATTESHDDTSSGESESDSSPIQQAARGLDVNESALKQYFQYDHGEVRILDNDVPKKMALLGSALIRREVDGEESHQNREMKEEMRENGYDVSEWGSKFLHHLRRSGLIKHDPDTDLARNKPFIVTNQGEKEFRKWISQNRVKDHL